MPPRPPNRNFNGQGRRRNIEYIPSPSSGAYSILVGMLKAKQFDMIEHLSRQQVLDHSKKYNESGPKDDAKIWSSITALINRGLVNRSMIRDPLYYLTPQGEDLAKKLLAVSMSEPDQIGLNEESQDMYTQDNGSQLHAGARDLDDNENTNSIGSNIIINNDSTFELRAGTFDIVLVIDQREKIDIHSLDLELRKEMRSLSCGDYIWVARPRGLAPTDRTKDLVLDYVIERKRLDDLQQSIFDGRLEEQKLRLLNLGVRRPTYLIEEYGQLKANRLTSTDLYKCVITNLVKDKIEFEKVRNAQEASDYLVSMTKCLQNFFLNKDLKSCCQERLKGGQAAPNEFLTYAEFQSKGPKWKNFTVREMFAKHLIQITGMSGARAAVISQRYPTMSALIDAYSRCSTEKEKENLLANLQVPNSTRIGPTLSRRVYAAYSIPTHCNNELNDNEPATC